MTWQSIETAPRDGTRFLACKGYGGAIVVGYMGTVTRLSGIGERVEETFRIFPSGLRWNPTHWMPLPPPPSDLTAEDVDRAREAFESGRTPFVRQEVE